jgi:hypothetical protein
MSDHLAKPPFVVVENRNTGHDAIKLTSGPYSGIIYSYGKVSFDEQGDTCKLNFEYEVHENQIEYVKEEFEHYIGDLLQFIMMDELQRNNITYTGGIDENRNKDFNESDI